MRKTAFACHKGLLEFNSMPFYLVLGGPSHVPEIDDIRVRRTDLIYLDDIIIYSRSFEEHLLHLRLVFNKLRAAGLKLIESIEVCFCSYRSPLFGVCSEFRWN